MITLDNKQFKQLENDLKRLNAKGITFANRATINTGAFTARKEAIKIVDENMINRNKWTKGSIRVNKATGRRSYAIVGSTQDYMEDQEFGSIKTKNGSKGTPIPTSASAGQAENSKPRKKLPRRPNSLQTIQLKRRHRNGANRKQRNLITVKQAVENGDKFVYMDLGRRKGIFRILGGKRKPRIRMMHDLTRTSVRIPRNPWLKPAVNKTEPQMPGFYRKALKFQLKRLDTWVP